MKVQLEQKRKKKLEKRRTSTKASTHAGTVTFTRAISADKATQIEAASKSQQLEWIDSHLWTSELCVYVVRVAWVHFLVFCQAVSQEPSASL